MSTTTLDEIMVPEEKTEKPTTPANTSNTQKPEDKKKHIQNFVKQMVAIEKQLESIREDRKDIIKDFIDNEYLTKEDIKHTKQAISLAKKLQKLEDLEEFFEEVTKIV